MAINIEHKHALSKKNTYICQLEHELEIARSFTQERATLKDSSGAYSYDTRLGAIELLSLEVAAEKVPKVIQAVGSHVFKQKFSEAELPSKTSVQNMADEGHFIAQSYISSRLQNTEYWGIHKDGTSRNKRKLLDTSITLSSGENFSLGFSCVAIETGDAISNTTKSKLTELSHANLATTERLNLATPSEGEAYMYDILEKLSYYMSDRAANEKSNKILNEWRDEVLASNTSENVHSAVESFHCTDHVLLGFHSSTEKELKKQQVELSPDHPLGRDSLPQFNFWRKDLAACRVVRTTSELFGPSESILVYVWESNCAENGVKSQVQSPTIATTASIAALRMVLRSHCTSPTC